MSSLNVQVVIIMHVTIEGGSIGAHQIKHNTCVHATMFKPDLPHS